MKSKLGMKSALVAVALATWGCDAVAEGFSEGLAAAISAAVEAVVADALSPVTDSE